MHLCNMMRGHCGQFRVDIFDVFDLIKVSAHAPDVCLCATATIEHDVQNLYFITTTKSMSTVKIQLHFCTPGKTSRYH